MTDRALPVAIFESEQAVKVHYLRRWLKDRSLAADEINIRTIIDWGYYRQRLDNAIQKIITIPAACQKVANPVPRVKHPDWLGAMVRRQDDTRKQRDVREMFKAAVDRGEKVVDVEEIMVQDQDQAVPKKAATVHRWKRFGGGCAVKGETRALPSYRDNEIGAISMGCVGGSEGGGVSDEFGSEQWLRMRTKQWRTIRAEKKRLRREQDEEEGEGMTVGGGGGRCRRVALGGGGGGGGAGAVRPGLGPFYTDAAATLHGGHWQVLTLQEGRLPGELTAWVLLGGASSSPSMHTIPISVSRQLYVNMRAPCEASGWVKVSRSLPRSTTPLFVYEVSMSEVDFLSSYADMAKWLASKDVHAAYHSHISPFIRLVAQLGCTCHVARGAARRSPHDGFALSELRASSHQQTYLAPHLDPSREQVEAADVAALVAPSVKKLLLHSTGTANRGVLAYRYGGFGGFIFVRPRGTQISAEARQTLNHRSAFSELSMTIEGVDSWEAAYRRLQRLMPGLQSAAKGPLIALAQTNHTANELQALVPALLQMPVVAVPHNTSDGAIWDDGSLLLGGAWQSVAIHLVLDRFNEILPWLAGRAQLARFAGLPIGCLPADEKVFACDILMHRRLLQSGQLSWLSPTPVPDLGGHSAIATDGDGSREVDSPELSAPGMYRVVCVELQIDNLAVNTVLESRSLNGLEGVDLSMEAVRSAETGDTVALAAANDGLASEPADDSIACASSFRTLKHLVQDWMRAVLEESDPIADQLLLNMYRWLSSSTSLMHDPALHRMLHLLMKKVWLQLLAEIRSLGARVVYASFTRVTIAVDKASVRDGEAYLQFLLGSITKNKMFSFLRLTPFRFWSTLLFLDPANYGGIGHSSEQGGVAERVSVTEAMAEDVAARGEAEEEVTVAERRRQEIADAGRISDRSTASTLGVWNLGFHLPPATQKAFRVTIDLYVAEPWTRAAIEAEVDGRDAPRLEEVEAHAIAFFDDFFAMSLLEQVHSIRRAIPSTGDAERAAVREGAANDDIVERTFPSLPGSHLELTDPALEFAKAVCHLASLERLVETRLIRLRRNILRQLGVREFALEGVWHNPSLSFTLPEVVCEFCGQCRDLDVCREAEWACGECSNNYSLDMLEQRLVTLVQRRAVAYQMQDVQCAKCQQVQTRSLAQHCAKCAGPFALRITEDTAAEGLKTFANIAHFHEMAWLAETTAFYKRG